MEGPFLIISPEGKFLWTCIWSQQKITRLFLWPVIIWRSKNLVPECCNSTCDHRWNHQGIFLVFLLHVFTFFLILTHSSISRLLPSPITQTIKTINYSSDYPPLTQLPSSQLTCQTWISQLFSWHLKLHSISFPIGEKTAVNQTEYISFLDQSCAILILTVSNSPQLSPLSPFLYFDINLPSWISFCSLPFSILYFFF